MNRSLRIVHLIEVPEVIPTLVDWYIAEWSPWYGPEGEGDAEADLSACNRRDVIPLWLVAFDDSKQMVGTTALKDDLVGSEHGAGPWLSALLVSEAYRGEGIGTALVEAIESEAGRLGFNEIFCSTDASARILERRGWQSFATSESLRGTVSVYRLDGLLNRASAH